MFLYEWKHFVRNPFKIIAIVLFVVAGLYGLHNGARLYEDQNAEVERIEQRMTEENNQLLSEHYDKGILVNESRPWIDYSSPYWATRSSYFYHFKAPSPAIVYSIGQSEQYGFYKRITLWASPYDADLAEEIANPERLQVGTLDFSFVLIFLVPLVLLVLLYNLKSSETERGFLSLIAIQSASPNAWLLSRLSFYFIMVLGIVIGLLVYGGMLTGVFGGASTAFSQMLLYSFIYLLFWSFLYFLVLRKSQSILGSSLMMTGLYLILVFIIPAAVHQTMSTRYPVNLMTDFIDVRDQRDALFEEPDSVLLDKLVNLIPAIKEGALYGDYSGSGRAMNYSSSALINELKKESLRPVQKESQAKNKAIERSFLYNPISFFQNRFNRISHTHFDDYHQYRSEIQSLVDKQIQTMVIDLWDGVSVDKNRFLTYIEDFEEKKAK